MFPTKLIATAAAAIAFTAVGLQGASAARFADGFDGRNAKIATVNFRIRNQNRRIRRGRATGRLNWVEARRVRFELSHIRGFRARYLRDGRLNFREARHLDRLLDRNARRIRRFATNGNNRWQRWRAGRSGRPTLSRYNGFE